MMLCSEQHTAVKPLQEPDEVSYPEMFLKAVEEKGLTNQTHSSAIYHEIQLSVEMIWKLIKYHLLSQLLI